MKLWPHPLDDRPRGLGERAGLALAMAGTAMFIVGLVAQVRALF